MAHVCGRLLRRVITSCAATVCLCRGSRWCACRALAVEGNSKDEPNKRTPPKEKVMRNPKVESLRFALQHAFHRHKHCHRVWWNTLPVVERAECAKGSKQGWPVCGSGRKRCTVVGCVPSRLFRVLTRSACQCPPQCSDVGVWWGAVRVIGANYEISGFPCARGGQSTVFGVLTRSSVSSAGWNGVCVCFFFRSVLVYTAKWLANEIRFFGFGTQSRFNNIHS